MRLNPTGGQIFMSGFVSLALSFSAFPVLDVAADWKENLPLVPGEEVVSA
jgi:hypothetical protein